MDASFNHLSTEYGEKNLSGVRPPDSIRTSILGQLICWLACVGATAGGVCWLMTAPTTSLLYVVIPIASVLFLIGAAASGTKSLFAVSIGFCLYCWSTILVSAVETTLPEWLIIGPFSPVWLTVSSGVVLLIILFDEFPIQHTTQMLKQQYGRRPAVTILVIAATTIIGFALASVALESWLRPVDKQASMRVIEEPSIIESLLLKLVNAFTTVWVFSVGASIGSFVNVLVYRMPVGRSVFVNKSACPQCSKPIDGSDNIPIFGWIQLKGKCRNCQLPISAEYPIIEFVGGLLLLLLFFWETLSGGSNIPIRIPNSHNGFVWIVYYTKWELIAYLGLHALLGYTLMTWWLILRSHQRIPLFSVMWGLGMVLIVSLVWPDLFPVKSGLPLNQFPQLEGMATVILGAAIGWIFGLLSDFVQSKRKPELAAPQSMFFFAMIGSVLGWQAVLTIGAFWIIIGGLGSQLMKYGMKRALPIQSFLVCTALVHLLFWRQFYQLLTSKIL